MIGLPHTYRFLTLNNTGQTVSANNIKVNARRVKFNSNGSLLYEGAESGVYTNVASMVNGVYNSGITQDNTGSGWLGGDFEFTVTAPASSNGNVDLYLQRSTDGGTDWGDPDLADLVSSLNFTTSGTKQKTFSL